MDRGPLLRKVGLAAAGLAVLGGAVLALRSPDPDHTSAHPQRPAQTSVTKFAAAGIVLPEPGARPAPPGPLEVLPGPRRLLVRWATPEVPRPQPAGAVGYEVRWGVHGAELDQVRLVAEPLAELDGLGNGTGYDVEVRSVDSFGQRSAPVRGGGTAGGPVDPTKYTFVDRFDGAAVPDPVNWRFTSPEFCAHATRDDVPPGTRLLISANCSSTSVALRARAPLKLTGGGVRGSVTVDTDAPGEAGELFIDLVPGPADLIDDSPSGSPEADKSGVAQQDPSLPPGTIRVRVAAKPDDTTRHGTVQVITAPGIRRTGHPIAVQPLPEPRIGVTARWQVTLREDAVLVTRDGVLVGAGDVTAPWTQATALIGFAGPSGGFRAHVSLVGFTGAATAPPVAVAEPEVSAERTVQVTTMVLPPAPPGRLVTGAQSAQLRLSLVPQADSKTDTLAGTLSVDVGGKRVPAVPAVRGQPLTRGVRYPVVATVPAEALVLSGDRGTLAVVVNSNDPQPGPATRVESAELEITPAPGSTAAPPPAPSDRPLPAPQPAVARASATLLGATGVELPDGAKLVAGRVIVDVRLDGVTAQRIAGQLAGLSGIELRLDGRKLAGVPTTVDGPGVGGSWRFPLTTNQLGTGPHIIEVRAVGVDANTLYAATILTFTV